MLKRGLVTRDHTLRDVRKHFVSRLEIHKGVLSIQALTSRTRPLCFEPSVGIQIQRGIREKIQEDINAADDLQVAVGDGNFQVQNRKLTGLIYEVKGDTDRQLFESLCNLVRHAGYPCSHILAVHYVTKVALSPGYFHGRWLVDGPAAHGTSSDDPILETNPECPEPDLYSGETGEMENGTNEEDSEPKIGIDEAVANLGNLTHQNRFLTLAHFTKGIVAIASQNVETATWLMRELIAIREKLFEGTEIPKDQQDVVAEQLQEAQARTKGRKKKTQIRRELIQRACIRAAEITCTLCEGAHNIEQCPYFENAREIRIENFGIERPGQARRCKICLGWGHHAKTCQYARAARPIG
jgi:hypothetical protein